MPDRIGCGVVDVVVVCGGVPVLEETRAANVGESWERGGEGRQVGLWRLLGERLSVGSV